jgi:hypothetical protein
VGARHEVHPHTIACGRRSGSTRVRRTMVLRRSGSGNEHWSVRARCCDGRHSGP